MAGERFARRYACHRLLCPSGDEWTMPTVTLDGAGRVVAVAPLQGEEAGTMWTGGVCVLLPEGVEPHRGETLRSVLERARNCDRHATQYLWHPVGMPADILLDFPVNLWERL